MARAALDRCLEGVTVPVIVHLCYGYPGGAGLQHQYTYPELLDRLMQTASQVSRWSSGAATTIRRC